MDCYAAPSQLMPALHTFMYDYKRWERIVKSQAESEPEPAEGQQQQQAEEETHVTVNGVGDPAASANEGEHGADGVEEPGEQEEQTKPLERAA